MKYGFSWGAIAVAVLCVCVCVCVCVWEVSDGSARSIFLFDLHSMIQVRLSARTGESLPNGVLPEIIYARDIAFLYVVYKSGIVAKVTRVDVFTRAGCIHDLSRYVFKVASIIIQLKLYTRNCYYCAESIYEELS